MPFNRTKNPKTEIDKEREEVSIHNIAISYMSNKLILDS